MTTLLPFLFQTRTILRQHGRGRLPPVDSLLPSVKSQRRCPACLRLSRRSFASQPQPQSQDPRPRPEEDPWAPDPLHETPETEASARQRRSRRTRESHVYSVPFEHLETPASRKLAAEAERLHAGEPRPSPSTLTDPERQAFQRLFRLLGSSAAASGAEKNGREFADLDDLTQDESTFDIFESSTDGHEAELDSIFGDEASAASSTALSSIERYPPSLQHMAQQAEARLAAERRQQSSQDQTDDTNQPTEHNPIIQQELQAFKRIRSAMLAAETDHELWQILDHQVFASMRLIQQAEDRLADAATHASVAANDKVASKRNTRKKKTTKKKQAAEPSSLDKSTRLEEDDSPFEPAIEISSPDLTTTREPLMLHHEATTFHHLVRAYPALVLTAAQLLSRRTVYSSLALEVLPAVKRIGLSAWALAASTQLYNERLAVQWRALHDRAAMLATLAEMRHVGVPADGATLALLRATAAYRAAALDGALGGGARALEDTIACTSLASQVAAVAARLAGELEQLAVARARRGQQEGVLRREGVLAA